MSWLFDRICELAVVDCVDIVIAADTDPPSCPDGSVDLAEVLVRAAHVPQLTVSVLSSARPAQHCLLDADIDVDLDLLPDHDAVVGVRRLLDLQRSRAGALTLRGGVASFRRTESARASVDLLGSGHASACSAVCRTIFATDRPEDAVRFQTLAEHDLGIAIGGVHPHATVQVDDVLGVVSIIDALVTLRHVAFGVDTVR